MIRYSLRICIFATLWYIIVIFLLGLKVPTEVTKKYIVRDFGDMGDPVYLPRNLPKYMKRSIAEGWKTHAFNEYVSNLISVNRSLPDLRLPACRDSRRYLKNLPQTDVIICFHNEAWSVLLRTVHSVINNSPKHLLRYVILVDDSSDMDNLRERLEKYWLKIDHRIKVIRSAQRLGIVNARLLGFQFSSAPVITFLDSHCECTKGWLEPLLDTVARNNRTIACPRINKINKNSFTYELFKSINDLPIGGFHWNMAFKWFSIKERLSYNKQDFVDPVSTPVMAGGLFSINRAYFEQLGLYDNQMDIWGGENLELSFRTWMCGGRVEIVPCSHVGHIFRTRSPYKWRDHIGAEHLYFQNLERLVQVWLDDFAKNYYEINLEVFPNQINIGNISRRISLRKKLNCHNFEWYLNTVYPEQFRPDRRIGYGTISTVNDRFCLDSDAENECLGQTNRVTIKKCGRKDQAQWFIFLFSNEIRRDDCCLDSYWGYNMYMRHCEPLNMMQKWEQVGLQIRQKGSHKCLTNQDGYLLLKKCIVNDEYQQWRIYDL